MSATIISISSEEALTYLQQNEAILIDVRGEDDFNELHIANAIHCPLHCITSIEEQLASYQDKKWLFFCHSGVRSLQAISFIADQIEGTLYQVEGGILVWQEKKLPLLISS